MLYFNAMPNSIDVYKGVFLHVIPVHIIVPCSNSLLLFLSILCILSSPALSFQVLLYELFPQFRWSALLPFPSYFNFHNFTYLGIDVSMHDMTIPLQTALNYYIHNLHNNTHPITKNISQALSTSLTPHIILIIVRSISYNLASSATVCSHLSQSTIKLI